MEARPETGLSIAGQESLEKLVHQPDGDVLLRRTGISPVGTLLFLFTPKQQNINGGTMTGVPGPVRGVHAQATE